MGESGCGKSTTGRAPLRLVEPTAGSVDFAGQAVTSLEPTALRQLRRKMQMVLQGPFASLNPRMRVGETLAEPLLVHGAESAERRRQQVLRTLDLVGLPSSVARRYPHEFSGGQRQRIAIARAVILEPAFVVLDESLSALDVSLQGQILELLAELGGRLGLTYLFISHDLSVVRQIADRVAVMYLGRIVEIGATDLVFGAALRPYTRALLGANPVPDPALERDRVPVRLRGDPPSPAEPPSGCHFHPRCPDTMSVCARQSPTLQKTSSGRRVACWLHHRPER